MSASLPALRRYSAALAAIALATLCSLALSQALPHAPFAPYYAAVTLAAWYGGLGPGLLAAGLAILAADYFVFGQFSFEPTSPQDLLLFAILAVVALVISSITAQLHAARQRAELAREAEHRQREWLETTLSSIGDAVIATDARGRVTLLNPVAEALTGWTSTAAVGQPLEEVFHVIDEQTRRPVETPLALMLREGVIVGSETRTALIARDGTESPIDDRGAPIKDGRGTTIGAVLVFRDITAQRTAERRRQEFISMVGHELRGPLTTQRVHAQLLKRKRSFDESGLDAIIAQADRLERLIADLTDASSLQAGHLTLRPLPMDLVELVQACAEQAGGQTNGHVVRVEVPAQPMVGIWDRDRLGQVVTNLLSNAIKYGPDGGEILVRIEALGPEARVSIRDQGLGIAPEGLPHVFEQFYRSENAAARAKGLGLGLYITRELVEAHGGSIRAESDGPGQGSTFSFVLPNEPAVAPETV